MSRPFLVVNPQAGGGGPSAAELAGAAEVHGVEVRLLAGTEAAAELAGAAAERGATALGVAGGDGSLAAVAAVALEHDLPFVPVPSGTRNHFARDLGLDLGDPVAAVAAFSEGVERPVDVGTVAGRTFLNNVSLGLYASLVHDPRHRTKNRLAAAARLVPAAFGRSRRPLRLRFEADGRGEEHEALLVLVANNDYGVGAGGELGVRERLDEGQLHAYVLEAVARGRLVALLARAAAGHLEGAEGWVEYASARFTLEARRPHVHAAIDGEPALLPTPLEFELRPRALRVLIPRARNGTERDSR